jgi:putative flippase GtrA
MAQQVPDTRAADPRPGSTPAAVGRSRPIASRNAAAQASRYAVAGATVGLVYIGLTLALSSIPEVSIQLAIPISFAIAVALHYLLQRHFVFRHVPSFALSTRHQIGRYVLIGAAQYLATATSTEFLPNVVGASEKLVYVCVVVVVSAATFVLLRTRVFHDSPR